MSKDSITALVPMAHVASVSPAAAFYEKLGFAVVNAVTPEGAQEPNWVLLRAARAELMLVKASAPVVPEEQAVLFYTYCPDIEATHAAADRQGLSPGTIERPFYNPGGEFRLVDPDGYVVYVAQM